MMDGQKIVFSGEADQEPNMKPGDVVIILDEKEHRTYQRRKHDLYLNMEINLVEALCGFEKYIETLDKRWLKINCEPGNVIKTGEIKMISDEGMPIYRQSISNGNLYVKFNVVFPVDGFFNEDSIGKLKKLLPEAKKPLITDDVEEHILQDITPQQQNNQHYYVSL